MIIEKTIFIDASVDEMIGHFKNTRPGIVENNIKILKIFPISIQIEFFLYKIRNDLTKKEKASLLLNSTDLHIYACIDDKEIEYAVTDCKKEIEYKLITDDLPHDYNNHFIELLI